MEIQSAEQVAVVNRIKRAQGQLAGVLRMVEGEREVEDVIHQLKAVANALDRAGLALVAGEWRRAASREDGPSDDDLDRVERLFISLG